MPVIQSILGYTAAIQRDSFSSGTCDLLKRHSNTMITLNNTLRATEITLVYLVLVRPLGMLRGRTIPNARKLLQKICPS
jgi:hypothetical protein